MRLAIVAIFLALASPAGAAEVSVATCDADLVAVDASFVETQARLEKAGAADRDEKCAAIRHHIEVMANGANVFQRCQPEGHDKRENMGQLLGSIADFLDINESLACPHLDPPKIEGLE